MNAENTIHKTDFLVIGSGIAGLSFALQIANYFKEPQLPSLPRTKKTSVIPNMPKAEFQPFGTKQ